MTQVPDTAPPTSSGFTTEQFDAAREIIRDHTEQDEEPLGIYALLESLKERFPIVTSDTGMYWLLDLIYHLQGDSRIIMLTSDCNPVEFVWADEVQVHSFYGTGGQPW